MVYQLCDLDRLTYVINHKDNDLEVFPPHVHIHDLVFLERCDFYDVRVQQALSGESDLTVWWSFDLKLLGRFGQGDVYHPAENGCCGCCGAGNFIGGSGSGIQFSSEGVEGYRCVFCKNIKEYHWRLGPIKQSKFGKYSCTKQLNKE